MTIPILSFNIITERIIHDVYELVMNSKLRQWARTEDIWTEGASVGYTAPSSLPQHAFILPQAKHWQSVRQANMTEYANICVSLCELGY